jgi:hypothetical protein
MKILRVISSMAAVAVFTASIAFTSAATASSATPSEVAVTTTSAHQAVRLTDATLNQLKAKDSKGYQQRYQVLSGNDALMSLLTVSVGASVVDRQVQELAATTSTDMVKQFAMNTRGKTFVVTSVNGEWGLTLEDQATVSSKVSPMGSPTMLPACWQAWVAAYAWYVGAGTICGAVSVATFMIAAIGGAICFVGLFTAGMVINWNNAC